MTICNTNPTPGCTENLNSVQIKKTVNTLDPIFVTLGITLDDLKLALFNFCHDEGENLDIIKAKLDIILANNIECCDAINAKLEEMAEILEQYDQATTTTTTTGIPTSTTTTIQLPCYNFLLESTGGEGDVAVFYTVDCNDVYAEIEVEFETSYMGCFKVCYPIDRIGVATNLGACTTTTTTCLDCTTTTSTTTEPTTTTTTLAPDYGKIYFTVGAGTKCNLTINSPSDTVLDLDSLPLVVQSGVISGCSGIYSIVGSWAGGSGNIVQMRVCNATGSVLYSADVDPVASVDTVSLPSVDGPYYVYITNNNAVPPSCPV